jgi:hypothetical protein
MNELLYFGLGITAMTAASIIAMKWLDRPQPEKTHFEIEPDTYITFDAVAKVDYNNQTLTILLKDGQKKFIHDPRHLIHNQFRRRAALMSPRPKTKA